MNLKFENTVHIFRKIIQLFAVVTLKSTNEYHCKIISKRGRKMDLYPAMFLSKNFKRRNRSSFICIDRHVEK